MDLFSEVWIICIGLDKVMYQRDFVLKWQAVHCIYKEMIAKECMKLEQARRSVYTSKESKYEKERLVKEMEEQKRKFIDLSTEY